MEKARLLQTEYHPSAEEAEEVLQYVRRETGRYAKIDSERITLTISSYLAVTGDTFGEGYWRPNGGEMLVDGKEPDRKQRWWCAQVMMATRRQLDHSKRGKVTTKNPSEG